MRPVQCAKKHCTQGKPRIIAERMQECPLATQLTLEAWEILMRIARHLAPLLRAVAVISKAETIPLGVTGLPSTPQHVTGTARSLHSAAQEWLTQNQFASGGLALMGVGVAAATLRMVGEHALEHIRRKLFVSAGLS
jgi:hypothetical protein